MTPITVGGFNKQIVSISYALRVLNKRLIRISDISGKDDFFRFAIFCGPHLYAGRSQEMPHICKSHLYAIKNFNLPAVFHGSKKLNGTHGILHGIKRNVRILILSFCFLVSPLSLEFLNVGTVPKHNVAKITGCFCCVNISFKSLCIKGGDESRMINVCMGKEYRIKISGSKWQIHVLENIYSLLHAPVDHYLMTCSL